MTLDHHQHGVYVEEEYLTKKPKISGRLSNSSFMFNTKQHVKSSAAKVAHKRSFVSNSKNVMIKITGSTGSNSGIRNGIDYISRNGDLPVYNEDGQEFLGKNELELAKSDFYNDCLTQEKTERKLVLNMVFSPPPSENVTQEDSIKATIETLSVLYPDASYMMAYHADKKEHPHLHVNLKLIDKNGKKFNVRKADLEKMKSTYAEKLQDLNYKAVHKPRKQYGIKRELDRSRNQYEVIDFGEDAYQFTKGAKTTPYIKLRTMKGAETIIWGVDLKNKCIEQQVQKGDTIYIKKLDKIEVSVPVMNENGDVVGSKTTFRNNWQLDNISKPKISIASAEDKIVIDYTDEVKKKKLARFKKIRNAILMLRKGHGVSTADPVKVKKTIKF